MEYKLWESRIQTRIFSWLQVLEGCSKHLWPERARDILFLRCCDLPYVGQLVVDEPGGLTAPRLVCSILHEL